MKGDINFKIKKMPYKIKKAKKILTEQFEKRKISEFDTLLRQVNSARAFDVPKKPKRVHSTLFNFS